jgi:hypothetical protein
VPWLDGYSFIGGPLLILGVLGILVVLLRWTFGNRRRSLVARRPARGSEEEYGLLVSVAAPGSYAEGELLRRRLLERGIRATLAQTNDGARLMVFPPDEERARNAIARG